MPEPKLMTDSENRFWLCEQVIEVKQQGGMAVERALAMLHKLTELESFEPYLSDQPVVPAVTWDYGEPAVDERAEKLYEEATAELLNSWPDVTVPPVIGRLAEQQLHPLLEVTFDDGLGRLPDAEEPMTPEEAAVLLTRAFQPRPSADEIVLGPLNDQPDYPVLPKTGGISSRRCANDECRKHLRRGKNISAKQFEAIETCSRSCGGIVRGERLRQEREERAKKVLDGLPPLRLHIAEPPVQEPVEPEPVITPEDLTAASMTIEDVLAASDEQDTEAAPRSGKLPDPRPPEPYSVGEGEVIERGDWGNCERCGNRLNPFGVCASCKQRDGWLGGQKAKISARAERLP